MFFCDIIYCVGGVESKKIQVVKMAKDKIYQQVAAFLKKSIDSGALKVGEAIYSENLLCEKLGVSRTSVRKAIRMMVEDNILESHQGKGTFIKNSGKGIVHNRICLLNHYSRVLQYDATDSYYGDVIYGAEAAARNYELDFSIFSKEFQTVAEARKLFAKLKYDGVVIDSAFNAYGTKYDFLNDFFNNSVIVDGNPDESILPVVAPELENSFLKLFEMLKSRKGPVFYFSHEFGANYRWRKNCFFRAAEKAGLEYTYIDYGKNLRQDNFQHVGFYNGDHHLLTHNALQDIAVPANVGGTIICGCDYGAVKTLTSLHRMGYSVPGDFAVSGICGIGFTAFTQPPITSIKINSWDLSRLAVDMLVAKAENRPVPDGLLKTDVIKRESL